MSESSTGILHSDVTKQKNREASKKMWEDPQFRAMMCKKRQQLWEDPEYRERTLKQLQEGRANARRKRNDSL